MEAQSPQISRSGRVLKKSTKLKEMEDFDINDLEALVKARKRGSRSSDDFDEFEDKKQSPVKISKVAAGVSTSMKNPQQSHIKNEMKKLYLQHNVSSNGSKESESESETSESSTTSSSSSDETEPDTATSSQIKFKRCNQKPLKKGYQKHVLPSYHNARTAMDSDEDDEEESDSQLVIAEDSLSFGKGKIRPKVLQEKSSSARRKKKMPIKLVPKKQPGKPKPLTAYMLWCKENRKRMTETYGNIGFGNLGKKLGEAWQSLPEKEKMTWRRKARKLALISSNSITTSSSASLKPSLIGGSSSETSTSDNSGGVVLGTAAIDSAAYLRLLGDSLKLIGQRLTEHEGQLAVSGIYSVLMDTLLCQLVPMMNLTQLTPELEHMPEEVFAKNFESMAYFMPGL